MMLELESVGHLKHPNIMKLIPQPATDESRRVLLCANKLNASFTHRSTPKG